jgi:hypothetical protein
LRSATKLPDCKREPSVFGALSAARAPFIVVDHQYSR